MHRHFYALLISVVSILGGDVLRHPDCCDSNSVPKRLNANSSAYECSRLITIPRLQAVVAGRTRNATDSQCTAIENDSVILFAVTEDGLVREKVVQVRGHFPKCCPLDHHYHSAAHKCARDTVKIAHFFAEPYVRVGLPRCKIIEDFLLKDGNFTTDREYCVDRDDKGFFVARVCVQTYDICKYKRCVQKCCPDGQSFINGSNCRDTFVNGLDFTTLAGNMEEVNGSFAIVHGYRPPIYVLHGTNYDFLLEKDGTFVMNESDPEHGVTNSRYGVAEGAYCIEHALTAKMNDFKFFRVFPREQIPLKFLYTRWAMCVSCLFLLLTVLYYLVSKEKRTLFGKTLICYCTTNLCTFSLLACLAFNLVPFKRELCEVSAFLGYYFILSCFTWTNAMCIDIYCTFGSPRSFSGVQSRSKELKRFMLFSVYGWGGPFVLTAICLTFYHLDVLPSYLSVVVNNKNCLILKGQGNYSQMIFSTLPLALLELCNLILFVKTAIHCLQIKREISRMNDTNALKGENKRKFHNFQDRFGLLMKLFLIMGISFLFEVISLVYDFKRNQTTIIIETIWDTFNCLQGLFIFIIFIMKRRIFKKFSETCGFATIRKFSTASSFQTQVTTTQLLDK